MKEHREISVSQVSGIQEISSQYSSYGSDYVFAHITTASKSPVFTEGPMKVTGLSVILCRSGHIDLDINLTHYKMESGAMLMIGPESIVDVRKLEWDMLDAYVFVISPDFVRDINLDLNVVNSVRFKPEHNPIMMLTMEEMNLMCRYFDLIHFNTVDNPDDMYVRSITRCLLAAAIYQMLQFTRERTRDLDEMEQGSRRGNYVRDFMQLVHTHHRQERGVAFYASKLFISPKYLSLIIKQSTGRSAAEWIDEYVILEAKNLLRFSGKNVQQVAYELNFSNQSSFGKYFKHLTGMSPTEFQRS
ncbi:MAG: AraC family transcriptional regulator [Paramuribaculum sp.]|nr:AraC family transcriptional regulator [Paramuribaculum sp.]